SFAVPMSMPRYTCIESALTTSPPRRSASSTARSDLPAAVGPTTAITFDKFRPSLCSRPARRVTLRITSGSLHRAGSRVEPRREAQTMGGAFDKAKETVKDKASEYLDKDKKDEERSEQEAEARETEGA